MTERDRTDETGETVELADETVADLEPEGDPVGGRPELPPYQVTNPEHPCMPTDNDVTCVGCDTSRLCP